jgi:hypothetical protein
VTGEQTQQDQRDGRALGKKLGLAAFLFFTIKGLLWLIVPFVIFQWGC